MLRGATCFLLATCLSARHHGMLLEGRDDWVSGSAPFSDQIVHELVFAIAQANPDQLFNKLMSVSDPSSPTYGQHLSHAEIGRIVSNPGATTQVKDWLIAGGAEILRTTPHGEYIRARASVGAWNSRLNATFQTFVNGDATILRTQSYTIPVELEVAVAFIGYAADLPPSKIPKLLPIKLVETPAVGGVTPSLLKQQYQIGDAKGSEASTLCVFEGDDQNYSPSDLTAFQSLYMLPTQSVAKDIGGHNQSSECNSKPQSCGEANLDVQYAMAVAPHSPMTYWYIANDTSPFVAWAEAVAADPSPPLVHSISYGEMEKYMDKALLQAFSIEAQKLGARGVTIVVASGDDGANSFRARQNKSACGLSPSFPASCPFVTAVGATQAFILLPLNHTNTTDGHSV